MGVSIDVFFKILVSMQEGRKENLNPKKRERELYSRLKKEFRSMSRLVLLWRL